MQSLLVYDGDCGFCTSAVKIAQRRIGSPAEMQPWQRLDLGALGLDRTQCDESVQYRNRDGIWFSAGRAVAEILRESPRPWSWLGQLAKLPGIAWLNEQIYHLVSINRHRLPGGTPACKT
jgi:predicted DCC family thiol-disulfide oxidoreductase YuxK